MFHIKGEETGGEKGGSMLEFGFLILICVYLQIVIVRDKKYRKQMLAIAKQQRRKVQYVPASLHNVVRLSDYRRQKRSAGNAS